MDGGELLVQVCVFSFIVLHFSTLCDEYAVHRQCTGLLKRMTHVHLYYL